ncbi:MAG: GntR family transcriptional regulator [Alkalibacterium gilvum]|uniref:GntR family transcriptional regulator n=1 Tax=Alkalibacterium gilvum TaxID=1130080 RepID=A0A1H6RJN3_9LACT|nr:MULTISPECIES: GntR family transcriptional regulator [Alkalibacterium]MDN6294236.1 GntR family transcriptional regulator [Alkalibacterium sp.]MDN6295788.1 GntR family transcriptional regulator [Alkalibacterium sp.]MDN6728987.1 GntR family transcriptional regulator [Alkalibacterium sp.]SEI56021.1 GntR family transcriptional regulator [Alkalibacterium gilvum]
MKKYEEIYTDIKNKIINGDYSATAQLPFEKDLCEAYTTSKMTVKRALDLLVDEGLIIKRRGSGTFVKDLSQKEINRITQLNQLNGFTATYDKDGNKVTSKILDFDVIQADDIVMDKLNLKPGSFVYTIYRLRYINDKPVVLEKTAMPIERVPGLEQTHLENSIYHYLKEDLDLTIQSAHRQYTVKKADEDEALQLDIEKDDPVAVTEQITYLDTGETIEYGITKSRADMFIAETIVTK